MDFQLNYYSKLLKILISNNFYFQSFYQYLTFHQNKIIILRHDVDLKPQNSLKTALIEKDLNIRGTYYFRIVKESYDVEIIKRIADLGHEIGYHYETMDTASKRLSLNRKKLNEKEFDKLIDEAYNEFCFNLEEFRKIYPVKTICMHGSPRSVFDNRDIWKKYNYKQLGIIGEPYFDIDFNKVFYLTDTGRCWNGYKFSVRDKMPQQDRWVSEGLVFRTTNDIIIAAKEGRLPKQIMITVHPQRWADNYLEWTMELVSQRTKNIVKWGLLRFTKK